MASGKRGRRPGGHPAKVAQRRERKRARLEGGSPHAELRRLAALICQEAAGFQTALDAELWASTLLGSWWPSPLGIDSSVTDMEVGGPIVAAIARVGGPGAIAALVALGEVCESELALVARNEADRLLARGVPWPPWGDAIMEAEIVRTAVMRERIFDDGITVFIETRHGEGDRHAIGVYIDNNLGVIAKDLVLAESIDQIEQTMAASPPDIGEIVLEPIDPVEAGARIRAAMELTDMTIDAPVGEDYAALRALAILRADELPGGEVDISRPELSMHERDALLSDFLAAPEADGIEEGTDAAEVARLAIDYCAGYVDGDPLRWSPVVVELFMADWLPRKLLADRAMFEAVPQALDAWVRYAGRRRGIPAEAIEHTAASIPGWIGEMLALADDDRAGGPAKQFMAAAKKAGIDLADKQAVETFIAGWNARSDA